MCKQSGTTQTVVQNPTIPDWLSNQFQNLAGRAEGLSNRPYNPGIQRNVANFAPDQIAAFDMTRQNVGEFRPYTDAATGFAQIGGSSISPDQIANYSNPFQQQVIDATMGNIQQNNELQRRNMRGNAAIQGGLGNDRLGVAEGELARNQNLATNQTLATLNAQNYNQALGAAQADRSAAQTAAGQFSNLGTAVSNLAAGDAARLSAAGGLQQALQQQQLDTTSANIAQQENYPYAQASFLGGMLQGASPSFTGTQATTTQPGPSTLNQILGLGAVGLGAFMGSDPRIKDDLGEVGTLDDGTPIHAFRYKDDPSGKTFFGPMSTDVAEDTKVAVGPDGIEMVDYAAVAEDAQEARDGYYTGGTVQLARYRNPTQGGTQQGPGPYQGDGAGLDALAMRTAAQIGQPVQTPRLPAPKTRAREMVDEANDLADNFRMGQTLHKAAGEAMGQMSKSTDASGFTTSVNPASGEGTRNMMASGLGSLFGMANGGRVGYALGGPVGPYGAPGPIQPMQAGQNPVPTAPMPMQSAPAAGSFRAAQMEGMPQGAAYASPRAAQEEGGDGMYAAPAPTTAAPEVSASGQTAGGLGSLGFGSNPALGQALMAGGAAFAGGRNIGEGLARAMPGALQAYRSVQMDEAAKKQRELQNRIAEQRAAQAVQEFEQRQAEFKALQEQREYERQRQMKIDPLTISKLEREANEPGFAEQRRIATDESLRLEREKDRIEQERLRKRAEALGLVPSSAPSSDAPRAAAPSTERPQAAPVAAPAAGPSDPYQRLVTPAKSREQAEAERRERAARTFLAGDEKSAIKILNKEEDPKEYQVKDASWAERMARSEIALRGVTGPIDDVQGPTQYNPGATSNAFWPDDSMFNSSDWKQFQGAAREWIAALLRKDTGAAVTQAEWDLYFPTYFPQPGDPPAVQKAKLDRRIETARGLRASAGPAFDRQNPNFDQDIRQRIADQDSAGKPTVRVNSPEEAAKLPRGTRFIGHDGQERVRE